VVANNVAHPEFHGSYSIKDVLTPLAPELSYEGLAVADGMTASVELAGLMLNGAALSAGERAQKRADLLEYCKMDTWAMVRLVDALEGLVA
jgi:hypothetical protein